MPDQKPTLDYSRPNANRRIPIDYVGAAAIVGLIGGLAFTIAGLLVLWILGLKGPDFQYNTGRRDFIVIAIACGGGIGAVIGVVFGIRRWRRSV